MKKFLKTMLVSIVLLVAAMLIVIVGFLYLSPQFGGSPSKAQKAKYQETDHYENEKFLNQIETNLEMSMGNLWKMTTEFIKGVPNDRPSEPLEVLTLDSLELEKNRLENRLFWFGHSAFLLQLDGKNILIDPMFGDVPAPHPWLGGKRFSKKLPLPIEQLPAVDAILISHDHYDHLDFESIQALAKKTKHFYVPLGVSAHLLHWGIPNKQITEMDWWEEKKLVEIGLAFTPARHFSGRGIADRSSTLWGSWVIQGKEDSLYFSGDSGYGPHFKEIGEKYGPFDLAMMECGQYDEKWANIHMMPEETAQAAAEIQAKIMMPIHWGAFTLALHSWTDPVERLTAAVKGRDQQLIIPQIGEPIVLSNPVATNSNWWRELE